MTDRRGRVVWTFWRSVVAVLVIAAAQPLAGSAAAAAPGTAIAISGVNVETADGTAPLPSIDPSTTNHVVATYDTVTQRFDVNVNTTDGQPHALSSATLVATLTSGGQVFWTESGIDSRCAATVAGNPRISPDGRTVTCVMSGPIATGTTTSLVMSWTAGAGTATDTPVTVGFTVSGVSAGSPNPSPDPDLAVSNDTVTTVVSAGAAATEVRKVPPVFGPEVVRDANGAAVALRSWWGVTINYAELPGGAGVKGASSVGLGAVSLVDDLGLNEVGGGLWSHGSLVGCEANVNGLNAGVPGGNIATETTNRTRVQSVNDSGSWSCSQALPGSDIAVGVSGVDWNATWFPGGTPSNQAGPIAYQYNFNTEVPADGFGVPVGSNTEAVVAAGVIGIDIPLADVRAADNTADDSDARTDYVRWCNTVTGFDVAGDSDAADLVGNNTACTTFFVGLGTAESGTVWYSNGNGSNSSTDRGPATDIFRPGPTDDDVAYPGQSLFVGTATTTPATALDARVDAQACTLLDSATAEFTAVDWSSDPSRPLGTRVDRWHSVDFVGTNASFPARAPADVVVEYASVAAPSSQAAKRDYDCDQPAIAWTSDPTTLPGGASAVNLIRWTLPGQLPPGVSVEVKFGLRVLPTAPIGVMVPVYSQHRSAASPTWGRALAPGNVPCDLSVPGHFGETAGNFIGNRACDRLVVVGVASHTEITDEPNAHTHPDLSTATNDSTLSYAAGTNVTFRVRSSTAVVAAYPVRNAQLWQVLPPELGFVGASVAPDAVVADCDESTHPGCVADPALRTDIGFTTLRWDLGDSTVAPPSGWPAGVVYTPRDALAEIDVTTHILNTTPDQATLRTVAWTTADNLAENPAPAAFGTTAGGGNDFERGSVDADFVKVDQLNAFAIDKTVTTPVIEPGGIAGFDVLYANLSALPHALDLIDVFPADGDTRFPPSVFAGTIGFSSIDLSDAPHVTDVFVTSAPAPSDDPAANTAAGTGIWACRAGQLGTPGCPAASEVTAIRAITSPIVAAGTGRVHLWLQTVGNQRGDTYTNRAFARASGLSLPVQTPDVVARVPGAILGDPGAISTATTTTTTLTTTTLTTTTLTVPVVSRPPTTGTITSLHSRPTAPSGPPRRATGSVLAFTGGSAGRLATIGAVLLGAGFALTARRRRHLDAG